MTPMEDNVTDPWNHQPFYNLQGEPKKKVFKSIMAKQADKKSSEKLKASLEKLTAKVLEKPVVKVEKKPATLTMKERYEKAWKVVFNKLPEWRQKELTQSKKDGSFGTRDWDTDFVRQVAALAESDDPLAA